MDALEHARRPPAPPGRWMGALARLLGRLRHGRRLPGGDSYVLSCWILRSRMLVCALGLFAHVASGVAPSFLPCAPVADTSRAFSANRMSMLLWRGINSDLRPSSEEASPGPVAAHAHHSARDGSSCYHRIARCHSRVATILKSWSFPHCPPPPGAPLPRERLAGCGADSDCPAETPFCVGGACASAGRMFVAFRCVRSARARCMRALMLLWRGY